MDQRKRGEGIHEEVRFAGEREDREHERMLDFLAEQMLLNASKMDEGVNGIIFHLNVEILDESLKQFAESKALDFESERALKMLKVYRKGEGEREFDLQKRAYEILNKKNAGTQARIPKPLFYRDIQLSPQARAQLEETVGFSEEHAEIIVMELIQGKDLGTYLVDAAKKLRAKEGDDEDPERILLDDVLTRFRFSALDEGDAAILYHYLREKQFSLNPSIIQALSAGIESLHRGKMAHRDLHERNVMISEDDGSVDVWIIDFGTAVQFEGEYIENKIGIYARSSEEIRPYIADEQLVVNLESLGEKRSKRELHQQEAGEKIIREMKRFRRDKGNVEKRNAWLLRHGDRPVDAEQVVPSFFKHFFKQDKDFASETKWNQFIDYLLSFTETERCSVVEVQKALGVIKTSAPLPVKGRLTDVIEGLSYIEKTES